MKVTIGCIGQGFVGKGYADDFEERGFSVVRYALEEPYIGNKEKIKDVDVVFIAVPTPTTPSGCDVSIVESVLPLVGKGKTAVIKSTIPPGTTDLFQEKFKEITLFFSPEFLLEATAAEDARKPIMNIVGIPRGAVDGERRAKEVLNVLPASPYQKICTACEAEIIKYMHNIHGVFRILFANLLFDLADAHGASWETIAEAMQKDPYLNKMASYYNNPVHKGGRGAGGGCFPKDLAAFSRHYKETTNDEKGAELLRALEEKNKELLLNSNKDRERLNEIYGGNEKKT